MMPSMRQTGPSSWEITLRDGRIQDLRATPETAEWYFQEFIIKGRMMRVGFPPEVDPAMKYAFPGEIR